MEVVSFDGKEYVKGSVVAERFRYTADYLGQLCRGKKVDARLIGRAWYVNIDSLHAHRDTRYKTAEKDQQATKVAINLVKEPRNHYLSRIDVEPIIKKKTVSLYQHHKGTLLETKVKYETDEYSLIPRINKEAVSKRLPITPAEAEELKIRETEGKPVRFKAEDLPEVYLHGRLKVADASDVEQPADTESETESEIEEPTPEVDLKIPLETKPQRLAAVAAAPGSRTVKVRSKTRKAVFQNTHQPLPQKQFVATSAVQAIDKTPITPPISIIHPKESELPTRTPPLGAAKPIKIAPVVLVRSRPIVSAPPNRVVTTDMRPKPAEGVRRAPAGDKNPSSLVVSSFKPAAVMKKEAKKKQVEPASKGWALPVAIFVGGFVVGTALLGLQSDLLASTQSSAEHFFFSTEQLEAALNFVSF